MFNIFCRWVLRSLFIGALLTSYCSVSFAADVPSPRYSVISGEFDFYIGQDGYCGKMNLVDAVSEGVFKLMIGKRAWIRRPSQAGTQYLIARPDSDGISPYDGTYSFVPEASSVYVILLDQELIESTFGKQFHGLPLFRIPPKGNLIPVPSTHEQSRMCLFSK
jgi:hypothetical protein